MLIGELADRLGVASLTGRFYERRCLMPNSDRTTCGNRMYCKDAVTRLRCIRHAQSEELSL